MSSVVVPARLRDFFEGKARHERRLKTKEAKPGLKPHLKPRLPNQHDGIEDSADGKEQRNTGKSLISKMQSVTLSKSDSKVLAQVFDPESGPAKVEVLIDPTLPADRHIQDVSLLAQLKLAERDAIQLIEAFEKSSERTEQAKDQAYRRALARLDQIVADNPTYASARNNRAQLRRWRFGDRNMICLSRREQDTERRTAGTATVDDLGQCIALSFPGRPQDAVSPSQGRLLAQAYTQMGALFYAAAKDLNGSEDVVIVRKESEGWSKDQFEEEASRLFYLGGLYGNEVAKALAVHTNPHAKLCGSIVKEAMRKELAMNA